MAKSGRKEGTIKFSKGATVAMLALLGGIIALIVFLFGKKPKKEDKEE